MDNNYKNELQKGNEHQKLVLIPFELKYDFVE